MWALLSAKGQRVGDAAMRGSYNLGAANPRAILTEDEVLEIHEMVRRSGWTQAKIAEIFGVSRECVASIKNCLRWKHLFEVNERRPNVTETKYNTNHPAGATTEERIASRLRNSGDAKHADVVTKDGTSPLRTFHNVHHRGSQHGSTTQTDSGDEGSV
jgi:DNA-binding transcriptional regulator LsrR (DeoR family)